MKLLVPSSRVVSLAIFVLGLPFLLLGFFMLVAVPFISVNEWIFLQHAEHAAATVQGSDSKVFTGGKHQTTYYKPIYTFLDRAGRKHTATSDEESRDKPAYEAGQSVPVLYDPADPEKSQLDTFSASWRTTLWTGGFGVVLTAPCFWLLAGCVRRLRRQTEMPALSGPAEPAPRAPAVPPRPPISTLQQLRYPKVDACFSLLLVAMVVGAIWVGSREGFFLAHARHTRGKVVSLQSYLQQGKYSGGGYMKYRPTLAFTDDAGKTWTFDSGRYGLEGRSVGAVLKVVYDPGNPDHAQIESFWGEWDPTFTFAYVGVFALLLRWIFRQATVAKAVLARDPAILEGP